MADVMIQNALSERLNREIQRNVMPVLPAGKCFLSASRHGKSLWNQTYRVDTKSTDRQLSTYFLKVAAGPHARAMIHGEYESAKSLESVNASCIPKPIAIGTWNPCQDSYFILFEFIEMGLEVSNIFTFVELVAKVHKASMGQQSKFGFHVPTYHGLLSQKVDWTETWEEFFAAAMKSSLELEINVHGQDVELQKLSAAMLNRVIPRLLRPLETGAQRIRPCLLHGDLWLGNCSFDTKTQKPVLFDACSFWGHNEYDLGEWGPFRSNYEVKYWSTYQSILPKSSPEEDYQDRICLYGIRFNLHDSALFPSEKKFRNRVLEAMRDLTVKHASDI